MNSLRITCWPVVALAFASMTGCATAPAPYDYSAFHKSKPVTLLVLPPVSNSPDLKATPSLWAHASLPLAEAGYYVMPVALVEETFRQNGVQTADDAHGIAHHKLREVFGADAAVYIKALRYGTSYAILSSETRVEVEARIVDLRSGDLLWQGKAVATSAEQQQQNQGGLVGLLVAAVVQQIIGTSTDAAYSYAGIASSRLFSASQHNGVLPGPRSRDHGKPPPSR